LLLSSGRDEHEYRAKWQEERDVSRVPEDEPAVFLEVSVADASEFEADLEIRGEERFGYKVLTVSSAAVPNGIAAICLAMRDEFGLIPHVYFDWTEGSPLMQFLRFILWGAGEVAPVPPPARTRGQRTGRTQADANYNDVISQAAPRSPRWPGQVPRAW
jgi:hypothetical protein